MQIFFRLFVLWAICFSVIFETQSVFSALLKKNPYCAVVMDGKTGAILGGENISTPAYPASLTKLMTLLLLFDVLKKNKVSLNTSFHVSEKASRQPPCKLGLRKGQKISVQDCILALAVRSANDVAMVVAENLAGSEKTFVKAMNRKAQLIGMQNTRFLNPSGWHHHLQKSTALDVARLVQHLWNQYPEYTSFLCCPSFVRNKQIYYTTNKLVGIVSGLKISKTGYTGPAGYNLATLTERGQEARIVVVMGKKDRRARDRQVEEIINVCYAQPHALTALFQDQSVKRKTYLALSHAQQAEVAELAQDLSQLFNLSGQSTSVAKKPEKKCESKKVALKVGKTAKKKVQKIKTRAKRTMPHIPWNRV